MYYPCSENKGADQLRGYRKADLRLCFRLGKNPVLSWRGPLVSVNRAISPQVSENKGTGQLCSAFVFAISSTIPLLLVQKFQASSL